MSFIDGTGDCVRHFMAEMCVHSLDVAAGFRRCVTLGLGAAVK